MVRFPGAGMVPVCPFRQRVPERFSRSPNLSAAPAVPADDVPNIRLICRLEELGSVSLDPVGDDGDHQLWEAMMERHHPQGWARSPGGQRTSALRSGAPRWHPSRLAPAAAWRQKGLAGTREAELGHHGPRRVRKRTGAGDRAPCISVRVRKIPRGGSGRNALSLAAVLSGGHKDICQSRLPEPVDRSGRPSSRCHQRPFPAQRMRRRDSGQCDIPSRRT